MPIWRLAVLAMVAGVVACPPLAAQNALPGGSEDLGDGGPSRPLEESPRYRLLTSKAILIELRLSDPQKSRLAAVPDAVRARCQAQRDKLARDRGEADAALHKQMHTFERGVEEALADILTPSQVARLRQLGWQQMGLHAFHQPEVRQVLRLSADQEATLVRCQLDLQRRGVELHHEIVRDAGGDPARADVHRFRKSCAEMTREALGQVQATLDPVQGKVWADLTGEPAPLADPSATPDDRLFNAVGSNLRLSILLLLPNPALSRELGLKPAQARSLEALPRKLLDGLHPEAMRRLHQARFQAHQAEAQLASEMIEEARSRALDVLTPEQVRRLGQVELQTLGLWAFGSPAALETLRLSPEQDGLIAEEGLRVQMAGASDDPRQPNDPAKRLMQAGRKLAGPMKDGMSRVLATFDADQKRTWSALVGAPFDVSRVNEFCVHDVALTSGGADPSLQAWRLAGQRSSQKKYSEAFTLFEESARLAPKSPHALSGLAWFLATCPEDKQRDGRRAVKLAELAVELAGEKYPMLYDTLAATYAETGDFEGAIKMASRALEQAPNYQKSAIEGRLKGYRERKPVRN
jgi:tetratricopeptide (TPR) repeat protein